MNPRIRMDSSQAPLEDVAWEMPSRPAPPKTRYVELNARTNFSFLRGGSSPGDLVKTARDLNYDTIGVTDCDGLYGMVRAHEAAEKQGIRLVVGCELTLDPKGSLVVFVENHEGYTNLCRLLTESHRRHVKGVPRKPEEGVPRNAHAGLPVNTVCAHAAGLWALVPPIPHASEDDLFLLRQAFGERLSLSIHRHLDGVDPFRLEWVLRQVMRFGIPVCATNAVRYATREAKLVFDVLHCIRECVTLDEAGRALTSNAEAHLKREEDVLALFADHPEWIERTREIADACTFRITDLHYQFPYVVGDSVAVAESPDARLRRLTYEGAAKRYGETLPDHVVAQLEKELDLIAHVKVAPYFLSVEQIVEMARTRDILCQGRGSAANSAVCYCLGITAVDPARSNLLFERFLSAERREPPDIDVDFEHDRREEVIQAIYEKYGRGHAAMVSEVICYRGKSALREVGKAFGFSLEQIDRLSSVVSWWDKLDEVASQRLRDAGFDAKDRRIELVLTMARAIQGFPRHLSIHVGGFVLSATPLVEVAPIEPATMPDRTVIPWDKDDLDTLGFFKVDVLGLGILTAIRKALASSQHDARVQAPTAIDQLAKIPAEDPTVYDALCRADTVGVFQIESRAQMAMLPRLKPRRFYDLVVEVAIVRPGPIQGGMIHPYLRRRRGEEATEPPHPVLEPILSRTLGVPLFQEQVMQIAIVGAGYTGGEADQLRRDMAAWRRTGSLDRHRTRLARGFAERGISKEFSERLYQQIHGFAEYGFPESHASSFALLVYASSWLKVHHPAEFAAALINSQPMGFYSVSTILQDAQKHGVEVRPISIDSSEWDCTIERRDDEPGAAIRVGLRQIRGLGETTAKHIEAARRVCPFTSIEDLAFRASLKKDELQVLAEAGALEPLVMGRRDAMWKVRAPQSPGESLFAGTALQDPLPKLPSLNRAAQLLLDYESTGLSIRDHPMLVLRPQLPKRVKSARELGEVPHDRPASVAGLVICRQRPATASGVVFITMEDETGFINLILYADVFDKFRHVATTSSLLMAHGKTERDGAVLYVIVQRVEPIDHRGFPSMSRDFH
ncbi:MAG: error-prone DNA polymerase [Myxococcota bacterium]|nr:error-prone DNA polymerase [Myxococcota bacterium]